MLSNMQHRQSLSPTYKDLLGSCFKRVHLPVYSDKLGKVSKCLNLKYSSRAQIKLHYCSNSRYRFINNKSMHNSNSKTSNS